LLRKQKASRHEEIDDLITSFQNEDSIKKAIDKKVEIGNVIQRGRFS